MQLKVAFPFIALEVILKNASSVIQSLNFCMVSSNCPFYMIFFKSVSITKKSLMS